MTLTELKYIVAVARTRHFGQAAEACFVSQPTLSVAIRKLEEELGTTLFERNRSDVNITPIGEQVVEQAKTVLESAEQIKQIVSTQTDQLAAPLKLGVIYTIGPYLLPHLIPDIKTCAPNMPLIISEDYTDVLAEKLRAAGLAEDAVASVHAPAGLAIHAVTPEEIALSILAGLTMTRRAPRGEGGAA